MTESEPVRPLAERLDPILARLAAARVVILVALHAFVFFGSYVLATMLRFDFSWGPDYYQNIFRSSLLLVLGVQLLMGALFGFYRGWWRYVGFSDIFRIVAGMSASLLLLLAFWYTNPSQNVRITGLSRGVLLIDWAFCILTLFGARVMVRVTRDRIRAEGANKEGTRVVIVGAGDAGEALAREIQHRPQLGMKLAGFVDDHTAKQGSFIRGVRVYGPISNIKSIAERLSADRALIAIPTASGPRMRQIVGHLAEAGLPFETVPGIDQLVTGEISASKLRPVNIEDLIRREKIELSGHPVLRLFHGKRVLITGAGGTIGGELSSQVLAYNPAHLALVERSEYALYEVDRRLRKEHPEAAPTMSRNLVDITDEQRLRSLIERIRPEIVLHAAAHKHVPLGEDNPSEYIRNNAVATRRLAELCDEAGVERFVFVSTDKAINPTSVMGASKRAAEILLLDLAARSDMRIMAVRFGNVLGSSGSAVPLFLEQIAAGGPVTVTHPEVTRYFLRQSEAISLVLQAATLGHHGCVFMLDMGEPIRIADLARDLIHLSGHSEDEIPIVFTGMRPGEKLYEEVRLAGESIRPTEHPQIVITEAPQPDTFFVRTWRERLERVLAGSPELAAAALVEGIGEYTPHIPIRLPAAAKAPLPSRASAAPLLAQES